MAGVGLGLFLVVFASAPLFPVALVALLFMGFCGTTFTSINGSLVMLNTDKQYYGRVMSLSMMAQSAMPFAALAASFAAANVGAPLTLSVMGGVLTTGMLLVALLNRQYRSMNTLPKLEPAAPVAAAPPLPVGSASLAARN